MNWDEIRQECSEKRFSSNWLSYSFRIHTSLYDTDRDDLLIIVIIIIIIIIKFDVHESVRRDTTMKITSKMHYID
jgi:hypothetical protein